MDIIWYNAEDPTAYNAALWNNVFNQRRPHRFPQAVVRARSEDDILEAVRLAIRLGLRIAVRAGGHSFEVWSVQDDSILIDLGEYKEVHVNVNANAAQSLVTATPSVTSKELNDALSTHGLFFPGGHCSDNWGWACEHLVGLDVVTAAGDRAYCDGNQNSDLYWAARGAGPAIPCIVTRFHLRAMPYPGAILSSGYIFSQETYHYRRAFQWALDLANTKNTDIEITAKAHYRKGGVPCFTVIFMCFKDSQAEAARLLEEIHASRPQGTLSEWVCQPKTLDGLYKPQTRAHRPGHRYAVDSGFLADDADPVSILAEAFQTLPHPKAFVFWTSMRPWSRKVLPDMALSLQSDNYFAVYTVWESEEDDSRCRAWLRGVMKGVEGSCIGSYIGDSEFGNRLTRYWKSSNTERLMELRREWDPEGRIAGGYPGPELDGSRRFCKDDTGK